mgnify:FL=1
MLTAVAMFSCQKAEEKADVEAGFEQPGRVPKVGIASEVNVYQYDKQVSATVLVSGIDPDMQNLEIGLLSSLDEYFSDPKAVYAKRNRNGSYTLRVPVTPGKTNWIMAMAACRSGAVYSAKVSVDVPDVPWQYKIADNYVGTMANDTIKQGTASYPDHTMVMKYNSKTNKLTVGNVCAYSLAAGLDYTKDNTVNYIVGDVDLTEKTVSFPVTQGGVEAHLATGNSLMPFILKEGSVYAATEFVWKFNDDVSEVSFPMFGIVSGTSIKQSYDAGVLKAK